MMTPPPPHLQKIFRVPPFFPKIIKMTPPPSKKKDKQTKNENTEKERKVSFSFCELRFSPLYNSALEKKHQNFTN